MTLGGPVAVSLTASSSNTNLAVIASLYDVAPNGAAERITFGALLGSQRRLDEERSWRDAEGAIVRPWPTLRRDEYLEPGETVTLHVPLPARQYALAPGHRLRLELTTRSGADVCPEEGSYGRVALVAEPCRLTAPQASTLPGGEYTLYFRGDAATALHLPVLPAGTLEEARSGPPPAEWVAGDTDYDLDFTLPLAW